MAFAIWRKWIVVTLVMLGLGFSPLAHSLCVGSQHSGNTVHEMFDPMVGMNHMAMPMVSKPESPMLSPANGGEIALYLTIGVVIFAALILRAAALLTSWRVGRQWRQSPHLAPPTQLWPPAPPSLIKLCISRT